MEYITAVLTKEVGSPHSPNPFDVLSYFFSF